MKLLIVESPNKRKTIAKYLGHDFKVEASFGHICDLPKTDIGVYGVNYMPRYQLSDRGKKIIEDLSKAAEGVDSIWLATDPDREGEAIAGHIMQYLKSAKKPFYRVVFNEITEKAIKAAIQKPRQLDQALFDAQQARRVIDRLVGYQVSPPLSQIAGMKLSAGRVQSIAIRLVVERERLIKGFESIDHYGVRLHFNYDGHRWFANWNTEPFVDKDNPYVLDKDLAEKVAQIQNVVVLFNEKKEFQRKAPPPFITTTLQKAASLQMSMNAEETMKVAQSLFEKGFISYHRTDNPNLSLDAIKDIRAELKSLNFEEHIANPANHWKVNDAAEAAHEAIRPTNMTASFSNLLPNEQKLYQLIRLRALASQMKAAIIETTSLSLAAAKEGYDVHGIDPNFLAKSNKTLYQGWRLLIQEDIAVEKEIDDVPVQSYLPNYQKGDQVMVHHPEMLNLKTKAPKRYTEPSLITKLEKEGIGRPSTYASILSNIKQRNYVIVKGRVFEPTPAAETIYDALINKFDFMEIAYTRGMEKSLDNIALGQISYINVVSEADNTLKKALERLSLSSSGLKCPICQSSMRKIKGTYGEFWGCSRFKEGCKGTISIAPEAIEELKNNVLRHMCPRCNQSLFKLKGKQGYFWVCFKDKGGCNLTLSDKKGQPAPFYPCPKCGNALRQFKSKASRYWICSGYKEGCKENLEDRRGRPNLKDKK